MEYIHIKNLEKYHPGYADRELKWARIYFTIVQGDPTFEIIESEIDKWRFVAMICLELQAKCPLPNIDRYWQSKGFNLKKRPMSLTLQMLQEFIEVVTGSETTCNLYGKNKKVIIEGYNKIYMDWEQSIFASWNSFCDKYPTLSKIKEISEKRRTKLKKRFEKKSFQDFKAILKAIEEQPFLRGENQRKWVVSFDWLIENDTNYLKVLEYRYKQKSGWLDEFKKEAR